MGGASGTMAIDGRTSSFPPCRGQERFAAAGGELLLSNEGELGEMRRGIV